MWRRKRKNIRLHSHLILIASSSSLPLFAQLHREKKKTKNTSRKNRLNKKMRQNSPSHHLDSIHAESRGKMKIIFHIFFSLEFFFFFFSSPSRGSKIYYRARIASGHFTYTNERTHKRSKTDLNLYFS